MAVGAWALALLRYGVAFWSTSMAKQIDRRHVLVLPVSSCWGTHCDRKPHRKVPMVLGSRSCHLRYSCRAFYTARSCQYSCVRDTVGLLLRGGRIRVEEATCEPNKA